VTGAVERIGHDIGVVGLIVNDEDLGGNFAVLVRVGDGHGG
jgi:hypothetical protein